MDPPLISDGQSRASSPEEVYNDFLTLPKSPKGCLVYLLQKNDYEIEEIKEWLTSASKILADIRKCDFELLSTLPSNYSFFYLIYSPDIEQNQISDNVTVDENTNRKYEKKL